MKYIIKCGKQEWEHDDYDEMLAAYEKLHKSARRGLIDFPTAYDENGNELDLY